MAHSLQIFNQKTESFRDGDLFVFVAWLKDVVLLENDLRVKDLVTRWEAECISSGPGTIDLRLQDLDSDVNFKEDIKKILAEQINNRSNMNSVIPAEFLRGQLNIPGVVFGDYPTSRLIETFTKLRNILS